MWPKTFTGFKSLLGFYKNIKDGYTTLEKAQENLKKKWIRYKWNSKREEYISKAKKCNKKIKTLYESREKVLKLFNHYSKILSEAKYKTKCGEGLQILTPKQMLQRLLIALAQVKGGNTSENLLNGIIQITYSLYWEKKLLKKYLTI